LKQNPFDQKLKPAFDDLEDDLKFEGYDEPKPKAAIVKSSQQP